MRTLLSTLLLTLSSQAFAGGLGVFTTGGLHSTPVYFYDSSDNLRQYKLSQTVLSYGVGGEALLGDRDDRIMGVFRFFWNRDAAEKDPAELTSQVDPGNVVAEWRKEPNDTGWATVGLQIAYLGDPEGLAATAVASLGSGFLTTDRTEFLTAELGTGGIFSFGDGFQAHASVVYQMRYRKRMKHGASAYVGLRYLFD